MLFSLAIFGAIAGVVILMLKTLHRAWWANTWVRRLTFGVVAIGVTGIGLRALGMSQARGPADKSPGLTIAGATLLGPVSVVVLMLFLSLPLAALLRVALRAIQRLFRPRHGEVVIEATTGAESNAPSAVLVASADAGASRSLDAEAAGVEPSVSASLAVSDVELAQATQKIVRVEPRMITMPRRSILEGAVVALPALGLGAGVMGVVGAYEHTRIVPRPMRFAGLSPALEHLKILQLTDMHLGAFLDLRGLEALIEDARAHKPDLVVLTGDFCDHLPWLKNALETVKTLVPRLGTLAVFGNHEYYRGADANRRVYDAVGVDLVIDSHRTLRVGDAELSVLGVDDPSHGNFEGFYEESIDKALDGASSKAFQLGLCHRPSGFPALAARAVDLTLSGHTHGAQIGIGERSIFEHVAPEARLWGHYAIGQQQLYTSSGGGHWFAFRLNCPSEAALVTLERA